MPRWASSFAAIASWTDSAAFAGSPLPPSARQVARENWYLPRYRPLERDRGRVAAGLAAGDPRERGRGAAAGRVPRSWSGARGRDAERASVAGPAMPSTVRPWERWKRRTARRVTGPKAPSAGTPSARWSATTVPPAAPDLSVLPPVPAARHGAARAVRGDGRAGDQGHGREQGGRPAAAGPLSPGLWAASARRRREARSDASQGLGIAGSNRAQLPPGSWRLRG